MSITRRDQCNEFRLHIVKLSYSPPYDQAVTANPQTPEKLQVQGSVVLQKAIPQGPAEI